MYTEKVNRQQMIMELLERELIPNQEELRKQLKKRGLDVTQATVSRDLRELGVVKRVSGEGSYRYAMPSLTRRTPLVRCQVSGNLVVFRTKAGLAPAVAYQIDAMDLPEVLGTVAGEDTLLAVVAEGYNPVQVKEKLRRLISER
jgi:transcriptional regulator of arginine metabolism